MRSWFSKILLVTLVVAIAAPASAKKSDPFVSIGDTPQRTPSIMQTPAKGLLDCGSAIPVTLDATYTGDTNNGVNNVSTYSCSFYDESGPELVFVLELATEANFTVNLIPEAGVDLDLAVLDQCDEDLGCLIVADTGVSTNVPQIGTVYFVVDGYNGAAGTFTLELIEDPLPEPVSFCDRVVQPLPGQEGDILIGEFPISGDSCNGENSIEFLACADYTEAGLDDWYEFVLLPGATIDVTVTNEADGAMWIVDACSEPISCLAYGDATLSGDPETVAYTNDTGARQVVYVGVDSYGAGSCGAYTGSVIINPPGVVSIENVTFGSVKARF